MTIQGSGGGRKPGVPPQQTGATSGGDSGRAGADGAKGAKAPTPTTPTTPSTPPAHRDGFESGTNLDPRLAADRASLLATEANVSGIESMVRILEDTRTQILDEHRALRKKLQSVVKRLSEGRFEQSVLEEHGAELTSLRTRLSALRRRLQHIQRRLKNILARARLADADLGKVLAGQLSRLEKLEPGLDRALQALNAVEGAMQGDGNGAALEIDLDDGRTAEERGSALARAVPGGAVAQGITHLLSTSSPEFPLIGASDDDDDTLTSRPLTSDDAIARLERLASTLLRSL